MNNPLRSPRVSLVADGTETRVTLDGLTKGYIVKMLHGWYWRRAGKPIAGHPLYGETRTKRDAVAAVIWPEAVRKRDVAGKACGT